jgi:hypothetical protein
MKTNKLKIITAAISPSVRSWNIWSPASSSSQSWIIFLRGFSLSSCPQNSLKVLLLLNVMSLKVCTQLWTEFSTFRSGLTVTVLARVYCTSVSPANSHSTISLMSLMAGRMGHLWLEYPGIQHVGMKMQEVRHESCCNEHILHFSEPVPGERIRLKATN